MNFSSLGALEAVLEYSRARLSTEGVASEMETLRPEGLVFGREGMEGVQLTCGDDGRSVSLWLEDVNSVWLVFETSGCEANTLLLDVPDSFSKLIVKLLTGRFSRHPPFLGFQDGSRFPTGNLDLD